ERFLTCYRQVTTAFDAYMSATERWFRHEYRALQDRPIAYFSAEFGLHEALPIYSGGLGILSGDHCKSSSDLGVPLIGVGFLYPQGYFLQRITADGHQEAIYTKLNFSEVPTRPATTPAGEEVMVQVQLPGRPVFARVWRFQVGRVPLFLLDTDVPQNTPDDRDLSARLYGGDQEIRISQEIVLGIGGVRALRQLGIRPAAWHMNEGHAAFTGLERIRELVQEEGLSFAEAVEVVAATTVFTTHTPVAAGHDAFPFSLMEKYFGDYGRGLGVSWDAFLNLGRFDYPWGPQFSMTVLALRLSGLHNGVSQLHGQVSRRMWQNLWPGTLEDEVPISDITNGIHTDSWLAPELGELFERYLGPEWHQHLDDPAAWEAVRDIPDDLLWETRRALKWKMIELVRARVQEQRLRQGEGPARVKAAESLLDPDALTIGFARRFAAYKRATLIFHDLERIRRILNQENRPVQIIFAGKAHPADDLGKALIHQICQIARQPEFEGKIIFVEEYDINVARHLVQGVDLWLNTPRRPMEASGTSGQKAALNGVLICSILDGWWPEAYNGDNGWAIGESRVFKDEETQDEADSLSLYATLEDEIVPLFYAREKDGIPHGWVRMMKETICTVAPRFNTHRMVKEYTTKLYVPAIHQGDRLTTDNYTAARNLAAWKQRIREQWGHVHLTAEGPRQAQRSVGEEVKVTARVWLGQLSPQEVRVEIVHALDLGDRLARTETVPMEYTTQESDGSHHYQGRFVPRTSGSVIYGVRVLPYHPGLLNKHEMGLIHWA
ncbi:MAG TPA: glycosyltransferase family 1 protein, partial [Anaerolineae bacterium]|nr:glycosyltransferase family 1 protein [Anaerolineae bacterium]